MSARPHFWRGSVRLRVVGFDYLCSRCWRYSAGDIPWCGNWGCKPPKAWNVVRRWRRWRGAA